MLVHEWIPTFSASSHSFHHISKCHSPLCETTHTCINFSALVKRLTVKSISRMTNIVSLSGSLHLNSTNHLRQDAFDSPVRDDSHLNGLSISEVKCRLHRRRETCWDDVLIDELIKPRHARLRSPDLGELAEYSKAEFLCNWIGQFNGSLNDGRQNLLQVCRTYNKHVRLSAIYID